MGTPRRLVAASLALTAALAHAAPAVAQRGPGAVAATPPDEARTLFTQGVGLLQQQRFGEAIPPLERSVALRENPAALAALAASYRGAGRYRRAIATLERLLAVNADPAREREVRGVLADCQRALARVTLRVEGGASEVLVDGERVAAGDGLTELSLDPGDHAFEARRADHEPAREARSLEPGAVAAVTLDASSRPRPATLVVETTEAGAAIRVDGQPAGRGRATAQVARGRHAVQVTWADGRTAARDVELAPGARVVVSLAPEAAPTPVTSRWWFWAGAGVLVAGAVVGGVVLLSGTEEPYVGGWGHAAGAALSR